MQGISIFIYLFSLFITVFARDEDWDEFSKGGLYYVDKGTTDINLPSGSDLSMYFSGPTRNLCYSYHQSLGGNLMNSYNNGVPGAMVNDPCGNCISDAEFIAQYRKHGLNFCSGKTGVNTHSQVFIHSGNTGIPIMDWLTEVLSDSKLPHSKKQTMKKVLRKWVINDQVTDNALATKFVEYRFLSDKDTLNPHGSINKHVLDRFIDFIFCLDSCAVLSKKDPIELFDRFFTDNPKIIPNDNNLKIYFATYYMRPLLDSSVQNGR
jgi:hypothetical protein